MEHLGIRLPNFSEKRSLATKLICPPHAALSTYPLSTIFQQGNDKSNVSITNFSADRIRGRIENFERIAEAMPFPSIYFTLAPP